MCHKGSFEEVEYFVEKILREQRSQEVPMVIVGNKIDLENERQVTLKEGRELAEKYSADFVETSAKTGENLEKAFKRVCYAIWAKKDGLSHLLLKDWSQQEHSKLPECFRKRVETFLLITKRNDVEKTLKVPKPIVREIIKLVFQSDFE